MGERGRERGWESRRRGEGRGSGERRGRRRGEGEGDGVAVEHTPQPYLQPLQSHLLAEGGKAHTDNRSIITIRDVEESCDHQQGQF